MGLFGPSKGTAESAIKLVHEFLQELGLNPNVCLVDDNDQWTTWTCQCGSAIIYISACKDPDNSVLAMRSPIVKLPATEKVEPLLRYCMEKNDNHIVSLSLQDDIINVISVRPLEALDQEEVQFIFNNVSGFADDWDNELAEKFGCEMIGEDPV